MKSEKLHTEKFFSVFFILIGLLFAEQVYPQTFEKRIEKAGFLIQTKQTTDGGYTTLSRANLSLNDYCVTHITATGEKAWQRTLTIRVSGVVRLTSIMEASDGDYFVVGTRYYDDNTVPVTDGIVVKLNSTGSLRWTKSYSNGPFIWSVIRYLSSVATPDGGAIISGEVNSGIEEAGGNTSSIFKLSSEGELIPAKNLSNLRFPMSQQMKRTSGGSNFVGGVAKDVFRILRVDDQMKADWMQSLSGTGLVFQKFALNGNGGVIAVGSCRGCRQLNVVSLSSNGVARNQYKFRLAQTVRFITDVVQTYDSGFAITGVSDEGRFFLIKLDSGLGFVFQQTYNDLHISGGSVFPNANGGYFLFRSSGDDLIFSLVDSEGKISNCNNFFSSSATKIPFGRLESAIEFQFSYVGNGGAEGVHRSGVSSSINNPVTTICQ